MDKLTEEEKQVVLEKTAIIKLQTVAQIAKCIEVASSRGAFHPSEMTFVGSVYDVLSKGLTDAFEAEVKEKSEKKDTEEAKVEEVAVA